LLHHDSHLTGFTSADAFHSMKFQKRNKMETKQFTVCCIGLRIGSELFQARPDMCIAQLESKTQ